MQTNKSAKELIKSFEGLRLEAYKDSAGYWTIGYGFAETNGLEPKPHAGMKISQQEADALLEKNLEIFERHLNKIVTAPINENEFGAMASLCFNIGPNAFAKSSVLRLFNAGDKAKAADAFLMWVKAGGKTLAGLKRRREAERALFLEPVIVAEIPSAKPPKFGLVALLFTIINAIFGGRK